MDASGPQYYDTSSKEVAPTGYPAQATQGYFSNSPSPGQSLPSVKAEPVPVPVQKKICGLRVVTFILSVVLVVVIIVAGVGAGVGASTAVQGAKDDAQASATAAMDALRSECSGTADNDNNADRVTITETVTATVSQNVGATPTAGAEITVPTSGNVTLDCPAINDQTQSITIGNEGPWIFEAECSMDFVGQDLNIIAIVAYRFDDCLRACASYNMLQGSEDCKAVAFNRRLNLAESHSGNCWLKTGTGTRKPFRNKAWDNTYAAAELVRREEAS